MSKKICGHAVSPSAARRHVQDIKAGRKLSIEIADPEKAENKMSAKSVGEDGLYVEYTGNRIKTLDDAIKKGEFDTDIWEVKDFLVNSWEMGSVGPTGKICVTPLWQVKVWLRRKKGWDATELRKLLVSDCLKIAPNYPRIKRPTAQPVLAELSIFDAHFGKLAWEPESGSNYDLKICRDRYNSAAEDLLQRCSIHKPERILYVVGNDFYHTDQGRMGATNSGTPQDCDGRWQKAFRVGVACAIETAQRAASIAPVDILCVVGNHDAEKAFCLGEVLAARFHNCRDIKVLNEPDTYAYYPYGRTLIGFTHGDTVGAPAKRAQLPNTMLTDRPRECGKALWREWHLGHIHSENEEIWHYRTVESIRDCIVRFLPSLSGTDAWHRRNNYKSVLAAECHLYHRDHGRWDMLIHQPKDK